MAEERSTKGRGRGQVLDDLLGGLIRASADFVGALVVSLDGLVFSTAWSSDDQAARFRVLEDADIGAVACRAYEQGRQTTHLLERGDLDRLILAGVHGNMIITRAGEDSLCVTLLKPEAKLGVASHETKRISRRVAEVLG